ncbi:interleukin-21 receptor-like isoform X2 [Arapaima gigas]
MQPWLQDVRHSITASWRNAEDPEQKVLFIQTRFQWYLGTCQLLFSTSLLNSIPIMALLPAIITSYLLFGLIQYCAGVCNVTCTTDYMVSLNCSCSAHGLLSPYTVTAECWNEFVRGSGTCEIIPPQHWCKTTPENFDLVVSIDASCRTRVNNTNTEQSEKYRDSICFMLHEHIKLDPPFDVQVTQDNGYYNISWKIAKDQSIYLANFFMYKVRLRTKDASFEECYSIKEDRRNLEIPSDNLKLGEEYVADVQITVNPSEFQALWSEWSPATKWKTKSPNQEAPQFLLLLLFLSLLPCLLLCYFGITGRLKWLQLYRYVPSPEDFFKPLYHTYHGNFQKWVGPTFTLSQFDLLEKNMVVQVVKEKQPDSLDRKEVGGRRDSRESQDPGTSSLLDLSSHCSPKHLMESSSQDTAHLTSHISIHTVTVSGDESTSSGFVGKSCGNCQPKGHFFPYFADCEGENLASENQTVPDVELLDSRELSGCHHVNHEPALGRQASSALYSHNWQLEGGDQEAERLSLDSFCSNDGYPHLELDLDTIDSGFLDSDCTSPVDCELSGKNVVLAEVGKPQSNYIRQWVTYDPTTCSQGVSMG